MSRAIGRRVGMQGRTFLQGTPRVLLLSGVALLATLATLVGMTSEAEACKEVFVPAPGSGDPGGGGSSGGWSLFLTVECDSWVDFIDSGNGGGGTLPAGPPDDYSQAQELGSQMGDTAHLGSAGDLTADTSAENQVCTVDLQGPGAALPTSSVQTAAISFVNICKSGAGLLVRGATGAGAVVYSGRPGKGATGTPTSLAPSGQNGAQFGERNPADAQRLIDPINPATGDFYMARTDLSFPSPGMDFGFERFYSSRLDYDGPLGYGWDHNFNQRIIKTDAEGCEDEYLFHAGQGVAYRMEPAGETAVEVIYKTDRPVRFRLRAEKLANNQRRWHVDYPDGRRLRFDERGLLQRVETFTGHGLTVDWEAQLGAAAWRVRRITDDSTTRHEVLFAYWPNGRLKTLTETLSGMKATYTYAVNGIDLANVADALGRSEYYEYSAVTQDGSIDRRWIPEGYLHESCERFCAASTQTCRSGKVCDDAAEVYGPRCRDAKYECTSSCVSGCAQLVNNDAQVKDECGDACYSGCDAACGSNSLDGLYQGELRPVFDEACTMLGNAGGRPAFQTCESECDSPCKFGCIIDTGLETTYDTTCYEGCKVTCGQRCKDSFKNHCVLNLLAECDPECNRDCNANCIESANTACLSGCVYGHDADPGCGLGTWDETCNAIDWVGECSSGCVDSCVEMGRRPDPIVPLYRPAYGFGSDLSHNLVRVYDGDHRLYLTNTYGTVTSQPTFDAVMTQVMGEETTNVFYRDLRVEADGVVAPPTSGPTKDYVQAQSAYEAVDICPRYCVEPSFYADNEFVPWNGQLLMVKSAGGAGGLTMVRWVGSVAPSLLKMERIPGGYVARSVAGPLPIGFNFVVSTTSGQVSWTVRANAQQYMDLVGTDAAKEALFSLAPEMTIVTEGGTGRLRAYPGRPRGLIHISQGSCGTAFKATANAAGQIDLSPTSACTGDLLLTPLATTLDGPGYAGEYEDEGLAAFADIDLFAPSTLVGGRHAVLLRAVPGLAGRFELSTGPREGAAPATLSRSAYAITSIAPIFAAPPQTTTALAERPVTVFHVPVATRPGGAATTMILDSGATFVADSSTACTGQFIIGEPRRIPGATAAEGLKPVSATVLQDSSGIYWTFYYDANGRSIRTVNHGTGAVRSRNFNSHGDLTAAEEPLKDRTCLGYDAQGSVGSVVTYPVPGAKGPTAPIRQRFEYQPSPSRPIRAYDPRDPAKIMATYTWTPEGFLSQSRDAFNQVTTYSLHEPWGAPKKITRFDGTVTDLFYDATTGLVLDRSVKGPGGVVLLSASADFDAAGRPISEVGPLGGITTWGWSLDRLSSTAVPGPYLRSVSQQGDGVNTTTTNEYDASGQRLTSQQDGLVRSTMAYDAFGTPRRALDRALDGTAADAISCSRFDGGRRLREAVLPEGERVKLLYDGEGRVRSVQRGLFNPDSTSTWDDDCPVRPPLVYTPPSGGTAYATTSTFTSGEVATYTYDLNGRPITMRDARGAVTSITYDGFGRAIIVRDPDGDETRVAYNELGLPVWAASYQVASSYVLYRDPAFGDAGLLAVTKFTYDAGGRTKTVDRWHFDESGVAVGDAHSITTLVYDDPNRKVVTVDDGGFTTTVVRDGLGRVTQVVHPTGDVEAITYSAGGKVIQRDVRVPNAARSASTRTILDAWGGVVREEALAAPGTWVATSEVAYDVRHRPSLIKGPGGIPVPADAQRFTETPKFDAFGRQIKSDRSFAGAGLERVTLVYDRNGRLTEQRSNAGANQPDAVTKYLYDPIDRLVRLDRPEGVWQTLAYSGTSQLPESQADARNVTSTFTYTAEGRLKRIGAGSSDLTKWQYRDFTYDGLGRPLEGRDSGANNAVSTDDVVTSLRWDSLGGKRREWNSLIKAQVSASEVAHVLDGRGLPTSSTLGAQTVRREFDSLGRTKNIYLGTSTAAVAAFSFDGLGGPVQRTYGNGVRTNYTYDSLTRLSSMADTLGSTTQHRWQWALPLDGVPRAATFTRGAIVQTSLFKVDGAGRMLGEDHGVAGATTVAVQPYTATPAANSAIPGTAWHTGKWTSAGGFGSGTLSGTAWRDYSLDGRSNWLSRTAGTSSLAVSPTLNSLDGYKTFDQTAAYNADGSLKTLGNETFTYNFFGEVSDVQIGSVKKRFEYDAFGRRVSEQQTQPLWGGVTFYGFDGPRRTLRKVPGQPAVEVTVDGSLDEHLVRVGGDVAATRLFFHQDRSNSVYAVTNSTGAVVENYQYTAYGEMTVLPPAPATGPPGPPRNTSAIDNRFGYQGQPFDLALGLVDMRARFYRPAWGRFVNPDPIGMAGGSNLYAFVGSAPTAWWDPMGTDAVAFAYNPFVAARRAMLTNGPRTFSLQDVSAMKYVPALLGAIPGSPCGSTNGCGFAIEVALSVPLSIANAASEGYYEGGTWSAVYAGFSAVNPAQMVLEGGYDAGQGHYLQGGLKIAGGVGSAVGLYGVGRTIFGLGGAAEAGVIGANGIDVGDDMLRGADDVLEMSDDAAHAVERAPPFAMGLTDEGLEAFANARGATTWKQLPDVSNWRRGVLDKLADPDTKVHFNLDGVDVWPGVSRAASGRGGPTDWELLTIRQNPQFWDSLQFWKGGQPVPNPFQ